MPELYPHLRYWLKIMPQQSTLLAFLRWGKIHNFPALKTYRNIWKPCTQNIYGGVAILFRPEIKLALRGDLEVIRVEATWAETTIQDINLLCVCATWKNIKASPPKQSIDTN